MATSGSSGVTGGSGSGGSDEDRRRKRDQQKKEGETKKQWESYRDAAVAGILICELTMMAAAPIMITTIRSNLLKFVVIQS